MISLRTPRTDSSDSTSICSTNSVLFSTFKILESAKYSLFEREGIVTSTLKLESESSARGRANARFILCEEPVNRITLGPAASSSFWLRRLLRIELPFLLNRLFTAPILAKSEMVVVTQVGRGQSCSVCVQGKHPLRSYGCERIRNVFSFPSAVKWSKSFTNCQFVKRERSTEMVPLLLVSGSVCKYFNSLNLNKLSRKINMK